MANSEPDRAKSTPPLRNTFKPSKRNAKGSSAFMGAALSILLVIIAGTVLGYMGIIDISFLLNYFEPTREQATQSPIRAKQPIKPSEKAVNSPRQPLEQVPTPSVAPTKSTPSVVSKEEKLPELETPTTILQAKADKEQVEGIQARLNKLVGWRVVSLIIASNEKGMIQAADRAAQDIIRVMGL